MTEWKSIRDLVLVGPAMLIVLCGGIGLLALPFRWSGDNGWNVFVDDLIGLLWIWAMLTAGCALLAAFAAGEILWRKWPTLKRALSTDERIMYEEDLNKRIGELVRRKMRLLAVRAKDPTTKLSTVRCAP
jgi:hypothetical protein